MFKAEYTAYGRDLVRITSYNVDQIRFALEKICDSVNNISIVPLPARSKLKKTCSTLEDDVRSLVDHIPDLRDIDLLVDLG